MKIATFNVNSVRARLPVLLRWLQEESPDCVALQETKVEDAKFPLAEFLEAGYTVSHHGQPRYNGVAFLSKRPMEDVTTGFGDPDWPEDCRIIQGTYQGVKVIGTYVPNGTAVGSEKFAYKLAWFERFGRLVRERTSPDDPVVWLGDINVAPRPEDVFDPVKLEGNVCYHPDERAALARLMEWGWTDCFRKFHPEPGQFTYWEFFLPNGFKRNLGWRIDHVYASPGLVERCTSCTVDKEPRSWERPSDHTPVIATFGT
ncbi:MAG: exodeoxyribonuclease III [Armatimonadetes bacterium]|nr:exodeoxyribonuclease III [Armatimonadota bacterium]